MSVLILFMLCSLNRFTTVVANEVLESRQMFLKPRWDLLIFLVDPNTLFVLIGFSTLPGSIVSRAFNPLAAIDAKMRHLHPPQVQALYRAH